MAAAGAGTGAGAGAEYWQGGTRSREWTEPATVGNHAGIPLAGMFQHAMPHSIVAPKLRDGLRPVKMKATATIRLIDGQAGIAIGTLGGHTSELKQYTTVTWVDCAKGEEVTAELTLTHWHEMEHLYNAITPDEPHGFALLGVASDNPGNEFTLLKSSLAVTVETPAEQRVRLQEERRKELEIHAKTPHGDTLHVWDKGMKYGKFDCKVMCTSGPLKHNVKSVNVKVSGNEVAETSQAECDADRGRISLAVLDEAGKIASTKTIITLARAEATKELCLYSGESLVKSCKPGRSVVVLLMRGPRARAMCRSADLVVQCQ